MGSGDAGCSLGKVRRDVCLTTQEPLEHRQHGIQHIATPQIRDDFLSANPPLIPNRLHDPYVLVYGMEELRTLMDRMNIIVNYHHRILQPDRQDETSGKSHAIQNASRIYKMYSRKRRPHCWKITTSVERTRSTR